MWQENKKEHGEEDARASHSGTQPVLEWEWKWNLQKRNKSPETNDKWDKLRKAGKKQDKLISDISN